MPRSTKISVAELAAKYDHTPDPEAGLADIARGGELEAAEREARRVARSGRRPSQVSAYKRRDGRRP